MRTVNLKTLSRRLEQTGQFGIFRRLSAARLNTALVGELDRLFLAYARQEAEEVARRWYAAQREEGGPTSDLADAALERYERAVRKFRPYYELDYLSRGERRTCRYRGVGPFTTWLGRQKRLRPRALKISFLSPSAKVVLHLENGPAEGHAYIWASGDNPLRLEPLFAELYEALDSRAGRRARFRYWQANISYAGICALVFGVGLSFKLRALPRPSALGLAAAADFGLILGLLFLFRRAWPQIDFDFGDVDALGRRLRYLYRATYLLAATAFTLGGAWAIFTTYVRLVW